MNDIVLNTLEKIDKLVRTYMEQTGDIDLAISLLQNEVLPVCPDIAQFIVKYAMLRLRGFENASE